MVFKIGMRLDYVLEQIKAGNTNANAKTKELIFNFCNNDADGIISNGNELAMLNAWASGSEQEVNANGDIHDTQKGIKDQRFQGLEDYQFEAHAAKKGIGAITVNGEKMMVEVTDKGKYHLTRFEMENGKITNLHNMPEYESMDELKKALTDKNNKFGTYTGINDLFDVFIP